MLTYAIVRGAKLSRNVMQRNCTMKNHRHSSQLSNTSLKSSEISQYLSSDDEKILKEISQHMKVYENFITVNEEESLLQEIEPYIKRTRYQYDHWDDAIHGYRETEKSNWNESNMKIIDRVRLLAFTSNVKPLQHVHVLDLAKNGFIKPHIDSTRFCGNTITGLSLLSDSVMRLVHDKNKSIIIDVLLKQRSLYIMSDLARYDYTHEILEDSKSFFQNQHIPRDRRISVICRNEPVDLEVDK